jgi:Ca-activated chloride channel family protein
MTYFEHPWFLLLAFLVPLVIWGSLQARPRALRHPVVSLLGTISGGRGARARLGGALLRGLGLLFLVLALAGPRWPDRGTRMNTEGIAIMLAVDVSGSMAEKDFTWGSEHISRLDAVKRAARLFVEGGVGPDGERLQGRAEDLIGYVPFAARPETGCPLTLSHDVLLQMLEAEEPRSLPTESETNIGDALAWSLERVRSSTTKHKVLILLSDGEHNVGPPALKPRQAAQLAASLHVPVYTVHAGGEGSGPGEKKNADEGELGMRAVASMTGGRFFPARDARALLNVYDEIDRLEKQPIASFQYRRYDELYPWFGATALALLVGVGILDTTLWRRIP